ncbi:hypothetical protein L1987_02651 [Smallanthus sonchifolius]|uniref:Uncharacterized protein n=1 Tax=Smallanthus sonchifolius TaxID=185202 RepID=A0ACB9K8L6_9ASTR|nr:hypothetical protein L1987_02651 [Smallanthus sonchifolius]
MASPRTPQKGRKPVATKNKTAGDEQFRLHEMQEYDLWSESDKYNVACDSVTSGPLKSNSGQQLVSEQHALEGLTKSIEELEGKTLASRKSKSQGCTCCSIKEPTTINRSTLVFWFKRLNQPSTNRRKHREFIRVLINSC